jgi:hypothetical protein
MAKSSAATTSTTTTNNVSDSFNSTTNNVTSFTDSGNITIGPGESAAALNTGGFAPLLAMGGVGVILLIGLWAAKRKG